MRTQIKNSNEGWHVHPDEGWHVHQPKHRDNNEQEQDIYIH